MKAYIVIACISGLGDQYASILSTYNSYLYLKSLGYDVEINWTGNNPHYFPVDGITTLDSIYDFSPFENNILYNKEEDIKANYKLLPQIQNSIKIYVSDISDDLKNYEALVYDFNHFTQYDESRLPKFTNQFLNKEVLEKKDKFLNERDKITCLHFRTRDDLTNFSIEQLYGEENYKQFMYFVDEYIKRYTDEQIIVCSNNINVSEYFAQKYDNVFYNKFTYNFGNFYVQNVHPLEQLITNTQEVAAEMAMFSNAQKIIRTTHAHYSSFLTYGIMHNKHHIDWMSKKNNLFLDVSLYLTEK